MSSAVDDDVARTVSQGRAQLGVLLRAAQKHLQKVFIVFLIGFLGIFTVLRLYVWDILKQDLNAHPDIVVVAITPFEVILLQAKIGLISGVIIMLPALAYFARDSLKKRGRWPRNLPRWKGVGFGLVSAGLFLGGIAYAYHLFFPIMFAFLAENAVGAGFQPTPSTSMWAQFTFLPSLSFGVAAQLPLFMSTLSYTEIVPYETFRDKWKHAVVAIFGFGALFSPPDPFTQIMWAVPLVMLYGVSLYLSKIVVTTRRSQGSIDPRGTARERWNVLLGLFAVGIGLIYAFYTYGGYAALNDVLVPLENAVDRAFFGHLLDDIGQPEPDAPTALYREFLEAEIDFRNLRNGLRIARSGAEISPDEYFIEGGRLFDGEELRQLASNTDELVTAIRESTYGGDLSEALDELESAESLIGFEHALNTALLEYSEKLSNRHPLSICPVLSYILAKEREIENIRAIARGREAGLSVEEIEEELIQ